MARRYFNWKLAVVLVLGVSMLGVTAFGLRKWQKGQKSSVAYEKGNKAFDEHRWTDAASNLGRYISSNPDDIEILRKYATAQMNRRPVSRDNINQAISSYRMIRRVDKSDLKATKNLSEIYLQMRVPGEAELILSEYPDLDSKPELGTLLAIALATQKKLEASAKRLSKIVETHPEHVAAYEILGKLAAGNPGIVSQPIEYWLDKAVDANPSSMKAYLSRADYRFRARDMEGLDADLAKAMEIEIADSAEKITLASFLFSTGKVDESEKLLEKIASQDPTANGLWNLWVNIVRRSNSSEKLLEVVGKAQKALELDPWDFMPVAAEVYIQCNKIEEAKECISKLKSQKIQPLTVARFEAMLTDLEGDPFKSIAAWREVIGLTERKNGASVKPASLMSLAMAYFRADDSAAGVRELISLLEDNPSYWQGYLILARHAYRNGNLLEASDYARKVTLLSPNNTEAKSLYIQASIRLLSKKDSSTTPADIEAIELQIAELSKVPSMAIQAELLTLKIATSKSEFEVAEKIIEKLKVDYPNDIRVTMATADLYTAQNKTDEAFTLLEQAMQDFPKSGEPVQFLVSLLAWKNEQEKCVELIKGAIERNDEPAARLKLSLTLADLYLSWNRQDELYVLLDGLGEEHPRDIQIKTRLLLTQKLTEDLTKAQEVVDEIKAIAGDNSWQWRYHQSRLWFNSEGFKDHYSEVISLLKKNLLENPTDQQGRLLLASSYFKAGDVQLAFSTYRQAFDRSPNDLNVILPMVSALYQAREFELADEIMSKVSAKTMRNSQLSRFNVDSHIRHGDYSTASDLLRNSLKGKSSSDRDRLTLAILELEQKNYSEAAKMLEGLKTSVNDSGFLQSIVAAQIQLNLQQNNSQEAIKICNDLVEENPDADSLLLRARTYASIGEDENALADFNLALEKEPENPVAWSARSRFYASNAQTQKAIDDMLKALSLDETDLRMQRQAIVLMLASGIKDAASSGLDLLKKSLTENPENVDLMMINARLLYSRNTLPSVNESALILTEISKKAPSNVEAWTLLAQIALSRQQNDKAINYAQRGLLAKPEDRGLMLLKARGESGRSPAFAIPTLTTLYDLAPDNTENAVFLADTYSKAGQTQKAVEFLKTQLTKTENEQDVLMCRLALAQAMYRDGQLDEAEKAFAVLMDTESVSLAALATFATLHAESRDFDECFRRITDWIDGNADKALGVIAIVERLVNTNAGNPTVTAMAMKTLKKIMEVNPEAPDVLQSMAVMYQMTGQGAEAISMYEKIRQVNPDDVIVLNNLAWAYCQQGGKDQQALDMANTGLVKAPEYIDLIDTRGFIYSKMGQYEKAIADFKKCLELYPESNPAIISTRLHLAKAFDKAGQTDLAIKELNAIVALKLKLSENIRQTKKTDFAEALNLLNTLSKRG